MRLRIRETIKMTGVVKYKENSMFTSQCGKWPWANISAIPILDPKLEIQKYLRP